MCHMQKMAAPEVRRSGRPQNTIWVGVPSMLKEMAMRRVQSERSPLKHQMYEVLQLVPPELRGAQR